MKTGWRRNLVAMMAVAGISVPSLAAGTGDPGGAPSSAKRANEGNERLRAMARESAGSPRSNDGHEVSVNAAASIDAMLQAMEIDPALVTSPSIVGAPDAYAVFPGLGTLNATTGGTFVWLSTGVAGAGTPQSVDPFVLGTQIGTNNDTSCPNGSGYDCVILKFSFLVPIGMHSVRFDFDFMSVEYPEYVDQGYNDEFQVALSSPSNNYPNVVFDAYGNYINIDSAFFNQPCTSLGGTGFDITSGGQCDAGATGLLTTAAPVEEGEVVTMTFSLRDQGDGIYDSAVMLDNFRMSDEYVSGPTTESDVKIDYLSPKSGHVSGTTQVQIHGEGFNQVESVRFDGIPALYQVLNEFTIIALSPPHSAGAVDVAITAAPNGNAGTTGVKPSGFTYYVEPGGSDLTVLSVDPPEGPPEGGVSVTVYGRGFMTGTIITFDGVTATDPLLINGDQMVVRTPPGRGHAWVIATNPNGDTSLPPGQYVFIGEGKDPKDCQCRLDRPGSSTPPIAALVLVGLGAAFVVRRRRALVPLALVVLAGCGNEVELERINTPPVANAGPDEEGFVDQLVALDGRGSHDFEDGPNVEYVWEIVTRPENSTAALLDPTVADAYFIPDEPGLYRVGLVVYDRSNTNSGHIGFGQRDDDNLAEVLVMPFTDFRVILEWDTDASDLDLHLIRNNPGESWLGSYWNKFGGTDDCFYGLPTAEWGSVGVTADNAVLSEDVDTGFGPEIISISSPQDSGHYTIVAHMFNAHGAPPTTATAALEVDGVIVAEVTSSMTLDATDVIWVMGTLEWPANVFSPINMMTTHTNAGGPPH